MTNETDRLYERVLVLRCQTGDEAAFEELVERYHRRVRYYLRRMLPEQEIADDVLQDVWFDVFRGIAKLSDTRAFPAWLYRIARDRAYRWLRKRRTPDSIEEINEVEDTRNTGNFSPDDAQQIHLALDHLAPEHREVLVFRFIEDMTYQEIAEITGCQLGTVKSRIHYAKSALRNIISRTIDSD